MMTPWNMDFHTHIINVFAFKSLPFYKDLYNGGYCNAIFISTSSSKIIAKTGNILNR